MIKIGGGNLNEALEELERERGISKEVLVSSLCDAMVAAYKKRIFFSYGKSFARAYCKIVFQSVLAGFVKINQPFFVTFTCNGYCIIA